MKNGFTLVELVVTILIISILGTFAFVRFSGNAGFAEVTFQERLVSALRNIQQRAMQDTRPTSTYLFNFSTSPPAYQPSFVNTLNGTTTTVFDDDFLSTVDNEISEENVILRLTGLPASNSMTFDSLGRPRAIAGGTLVEACAGGCEIDFVGEQTARVCIEPEGYIHSGNCDA